MPMVLDRVEWSYLAAAIERRARLLNSILVDLYGSQSLLNKGLPPELVFPNTAFLRPRCDVLVPGERTCTCTRLISPVLPTATGG